MTTLNRVLSILIALLAIAATVLSYLLFEKRNEFRGRADKLASAMAEMVETMARDSQTNADQQVTFTPADPRAGRAEKGTLGWKAYQEARNAQGNYPAFESTMDTATGLADNVHTQRNFLADILYEAGITLGIPEDAVDPAQLKSLESEDSYRPPAQQVLGYTKAVAERDNAMVEALMETAKTVQANVQKERLTSPTRTTNLEGEKTWAFQHEKALNAITNNTKQLNTRAENYAKTLVNAIRQVNKYDWETKPAAIRDEQQYTRALNTLLNDFEGINGKLAQLQKAQQELSRTKAKLVDAEEELKDMRRNLAETRKQLASLQEQAGVAGEGGPTITPRVQRLPEGEPINEDLEGQVLKVNQKRKYVVLDLGYDKVRVGTELLIARDDNFIARVQITKVTEEHAIADVLPTVKTDDVEPGDRVIVPKTMSM